MKNSWNKRVLVSWNIATFLSWWIQALTVQTVFSETLFPPQIGYSHLKARECNIYRDLPAWNGAESAHASFHGDVARNERLLRFHWLNRTEAVLCCHLICFMETHQQQLINYLRGNNVKTAAPWEYSLICLLYAFCTIRSCKILHTGPLNLLLLLLWMQTFGLYGLFYVWEMIWDSITLWSPHQHCELLISLSLRSSV